MKIRNGFVSNSSSSSFIVIFDKVPSSVGEVHDLLFGPDPKMLQPDWSSSGEYAASSTELASTIWYNIKEQLNNPASNADIEDQLSSEVWSEVQQEKYPELWRMEDDPYREALNELDAITAVKTKERLADLVAQNKDRQVFLFEYGDNHGSMTGRVGTVLENCDVFKKVTHVKINNH